MYVTHYRGEYNHKRRILTDYTKKLITDMMTHRYVSHLYKLNLFVGSISIIRFMKLAFGKGEIQEP